MTTDVYLFSNAGYPAGDVILRPSAASVTPIPTIAYGGAPPIRRRLVHHRGILRYRLLLRSSGALEHHDPEPVVVRTALTSAPARIRGHGQIIFRIGQADSGGFACRSALRFELVTTDAVRIEDPDEWVVFDDPAFS